MKETPILFSGPMVRALREGRKTMTRRVVKPFISDLASMKQVRMMEHVPTGQHQAFFSDGKSKNWFGTPCPYGQPGDRLWVKETFREAGSAQQADGKLRAGRDQLVYKADDDTDLGPWRPSIFMPRWASRLILELTAVRVERIQDISDGDAQWEGCEPDDAALERDIIDFVPSFRRLWDSINAARGYGWAVNPWVWVLDLKPVEVSR